MKVHQIYWAGRCVREQLRLKFDVRRRGSILTDGTDGTIRLGFYFFILCDFFTSMTLKNNLGPSTYIADFDPEQYKEGEYIEVKITDDKTYYFTDGLIRSLTDFKSSKKIKKDMKRWRRRSSLQNHCSSRGTREQYSILDARQKAVKGRVTGNILPLLIPNYNFNSLFLCAVSCYSRDSPAKRIRYVHIDLSSSTLNFPSTVVSCVYIPTHKVITTMLTPIYKCRWYNNTIIVCLYTGFSESK